MSFRQLDVDHLDPNSVVNNFVPTIEPTTTRAEVESVAAQVRGFVQGGKLNEALQAAIATPPYGCDEDTKTVATSSIVEVLIQARSAEIGSVLKDLQTEQVDILVKYVYRAMKTADSQQTCSALLNWLDKINELFGVAPTTRYINDRRVI